MRDSPPVARVFALIILIAVAYVAFTRRAFDYGADPATYAGLARSIVSGDGYWFNSRPHTLYPPGYPLLLVPVSALTAHDFAALAMFTGIIAAGAIAVTAWYGHERLGEFWYAPALLLVVSSRYFGHATSGVESEAPYLMASVAFLACAERLARPGRAAPPGVVLAAPLLLVAAMAVRGVGVALLPAAVLTLATLFFRRRHLDPAVWRRARLALVLSIVSGAAYFAAWSVWTKTMRQPLYAGEYADVYAGQLGMIDPRRPDLGTATLWDMIQRVPQGVVNQSAHTAELLTNFSWFFPVWYLAPVLIVLLCAVVGIILELRRRNPILGWYLAGYVAVLSLWPFDDGPRFMLPVLPLIAIVVAQGAVFLWRQLVLRARWALSLVVMAAAAGIIGTIASPGELSRQEQLSLILWLGLVPSALLAPRAEGVARGSWIARPHGIVIAALGAVAVLGVPQMAETVSLRLNHSSIGRNEGVRQASDWLRRNASAAAVVMADASAGIHFATGLRTVPFPVSFDPGRLRRGFEQLQPDILVVEARRPFEYFTPTQGERLGIIRANGIANLRELAAFDGARVYAVDRQPLAGVAESDSLRVRQSSR